ncbi:MAG TPA: helix-turn-helix transcriptional regulator [Firmicutes bacterium]|nr:helix-turn-helix transcriptional regulator [Bacillota bacterium]
MDINRLLGLRIKRIRKELGMSQEELAEKADMNVANIRQIEAMKGNPTMESVAKLARAFQIRPMDLLNFDREYRKLEFYEDPEQALRDLIAPLRPEEQAEIISLVAMVVSTMR